MMDDRGVKIVSLAREMMRNEAYHSPTSAPHITMSFKVLVLTTLMTAFGSSALTELVIEENRPINHYEKTELDALVFYIAHLKGIEETALRQQIASRFGIARFDEITEQDFRNVRLSLQKLAP